MLGIGSCVWGGEEVSLSGSAVPKEVSAVRMVLGLLNSEPGSFS